MMTAKEIDERRKYLLAELQNLQMRLISAKDFAPHKVAYYEERIEIINYELTFVS